MSDDVHAVTRLRNALRMNAAFSSATGLVGVAFGGPVADLLGLSGAGPTVVRLISGGLVVFAALLLFEAGRPAGALLGSALRISVADLLWVTGTMVAIASGAFSARGAVVAAVVGLIVLELVIVQLRARSRAKRTLAWRLSAWRSRSARSCVGSSGVG